MSLTTLKGKVEQLIEKAQSGGGDTRFADLVVNRTVNELDNSITKIGNYAFYGCSLPADIDFSNIKSIGAYGMYGAYGVTELSFPNLTSLGEQSLRNMQRVTSVSLPLVRTLTTSCLNQMTALKNVYIPEVTSLSMSVFADSGIEEIDIPKLEYITAGYIFSGCRKLKKFRFYNKLKDRNGMNSSMFANC